MKPCRLVPALSLLLSALVGTLLDTGGYTFYYAEGASYLSDDPRACVNCHIMRANATLDFIHAIESAASSGLSDDQLASAHKFHRQAEWRLDFS